MSDHDFEKKIQQKMDELKLTPSAGVWMSVEKNINRDKRRRRAIFWLPLLFLLLGGSGYFFFTNNSSTKNTTTSSTSTQSNTAVADNTKTSNKPSSEIKDPAIKNKEIKPAIKTNIVKLHVPQAGLATKKNYSNDQKVLGKKGTMYGGLAKVKHPTLRVSENNKTTGKEIAGSVTTKVKEPQAKDNTSNEEQNVADASKAGQPTSADLSKSASSETTPLDSVQQVTAKKDFLRTLSTDLNVVATKIKRPQAQTKNSSKWKFGLMGNIGISKIVKGGDIFRKSSVANDFNAISSPGASTGGYIYSPASPVYPGLTFSIGGFASHSISKRVDILIGLAYTYMSTTTSIGNRVDSVRLVSSGSQTYSLVSNYYPNSNTHRYTNSYHFIEMPISIEWKFNEKKKMPFSWESGLQLMQLLSTNAVHYDRSHGIYFENSSYFNKTQLGIYTGLSFETFAKSKHPLWIGPRMDYLFTNLLKKNVSNDQHLFSVGISAKMLLKN